jgi:multisubunit Na+/H+ antiporter MnhC subunit
VNMVSSTDGWIVGDDRSIFRWQEEIPNFFIIYAIIIGVATLVLAIWLYLRYTRKRISKQKALVNIEQPR